MCGIVGVASARGTTTIESSCDTLSHRGPDARGVWTSSDRQVAFGHRRLAVIDLSDAASQPMADAGGRYQMILNGEIYNYRELRNRLEGLGHTFRSASDTEVLLQAYLQWGRDCLLQLRGQFAFVIYDARERHLFAARDRAGEKPLFYHHGERGLAFASELKAILSMPGMTRRMNAEALDHYLAYGYVPGELCLLEGIRKLPPAHALSYDIATNSLEVTRYWASPPPFSGDSWDAEELLDELDTLLEDSVRHQLVADVPVGILLSGGVDSSLITAIASRVASGPVRTFNIAFPGHGVYDEAPFARMVASHFGTQHTELVAEPADISLLPELARQFDEPIGDSSMVPTYLVSRLVRESCTVALGGDAGDELFGGYMHHSRVQQQARMSALIPPPLRRAMGALAGTLPVGFRGRTYLRSLSFPASDAWVAATLHFDRATRRRLSPATARLEGSPPEDFRRRAGASGKTLLQKVTAADFSTYLPEDILVKVDRASMLASLEVRAPLLDPRIIEFAMSRVPDSLRATASERKILLKRLAARLLPPALDLQRKQGFSLPLDSWFKGSWGGFFTEVLKGAPEKLFASREIDRLLDGQRRGYSSAQRLFNLTLLELWRREYDVELPGSAGA